MITNISHALDLETINENDFSNIQILDDRDNVHFSYKGVPFHFSISEIESNYNKDDATLNKIQAIEKIAGFTVFFGDHEEIDFHWTEITYNISKYDFIQLACMFPNLWFFHSEIVESDEKGITFYAYMNKEEKEYSLQAPEVESQKVKLAFNKNAFRIFEGLQNLKINFVASYGYTYASVESENVFLADQQKDVCKWLGLLKLTPTTEDNYQLFFDIDFTCTVQNGIATFQIGNFTFDYQF